MGYTGHTYSSLTADQTKQMLTSLRHTEALSSAGCAIFIIASYGNEDTFLTSDMKHISKEWICDLFKDSECPNLKNKPKLFLFDLHHCNNNIENDEEPCPAKCERVTEPRQDMICLYTSGGENFTSYNLAKDGTPFARALCRTLAQHAHNLELTELYKEFLKEYNITCPSGAPQLCQYGFTKKFYFNPRSSDLKLF